MNPKTAVTRFQLEAAVFWYVQFNLRKIESTSGTSFSGVKNMTLESQPSRANEVLAPKATPHRMGLSLNWWVVCTRSLTVLPVSRALPKPAFLATYFGRFPDSCSRTGTNRVYSFSDKAFQGLLAGFTSVARG
jgi:hypothetical protein